MGIKGRGRVFICWASRYYFRHLWEVEQNYCHVKWLLKAIFSRSDHQLPKNKLSFTLCSIYILLISNKFHKFWMSCKCRSRYTKIEAKRRKSQADRSHLGRPTGLTYMKCLWAVDFKTVWSKGPKVINHGLKDPLACKTRAKHLRTTSLDKAQALIKSVKWRDEKCWSQVDRPGP
jgi:hypothetical protein